MRAKGPARSRAGASAARGVRRGAGRRQRGAQAGRGRTRARKVATWGGGLKGSRRSATAQAMMQSNAMCTAAANPSSEVSAACLGAGACRTVLAPVEPRRFWSGSLSVT